MSSQQNSAQKAPDTCESHRSEFALLPPSWQAVHSAVLRTKNRAWTQSRSQTNPGARAKPALIGPCASHVLARGQAELKNGLENRLASGCYLPGRPGHQIPTQQSTVSSYLVTPLAYPSSHGPVQQPPEPNGECDFAPAGSSVRRVHSCYLTPMTILGNPVAIPGNMQSKNTATNISPRNGITPQITSFSGISGATFLITKIFKPTGG